jgi:hypothetical protein
MQKRKTNTDALAGMRQQLTEIIAEYPTVERFCWDNNLNKATVSNFLRGKKDFQLSTLVKIANTLGKRLTIRLD